VTEAEFIHTVRRIGAFPCLNVSLHPLGLSIAYGYNEQTRQPFQLIIPWPVVESAVRQKYAADDIEQSRRRDQKE
jgi:hypothetical protein